MCDSVLRTVASRPVGCRRSGGTVKRSSLALAPPIRTGTKRALIATWIGTGQLIVRSSGSVRKGCFVSASSRIAMPPRRPMPLRL